MNHNVDVYVCKSVLDIHVLTGGDVMCDVMGDDSMASWHQHYVTISQMWSIYESRMYSDCTMCS